MASKKRNVIVGQSGGPTSVINSSLAGVYKNAIERGFDKVYGGIRIWTGSSHDANHGSAGRSAGSYPSDFGTCFPAGRCIYQSDRSDFRMSDRFSGYCQNRVVQLDQVHVEIPGCVDDRCCDHDFDCGWNRILMMVLFTETD